mmetsp:Transcript_10089/g.22123  ORF Transcript_10089/g.22123 Transcript_10089/m.22123 type:complete len:161 (-) Transcript_10089:12-494(-)
MSHQGDGRVQCLQEDLGPLANPRSTMQGQAVSGSQLHGNPRTYAAVEETTTSHGRPPSTGNESRVPGKTIVYCSDDGDYQYIKFFRNSLAIQFQSFAMVAYHPDWYVLFFSIERIKSRVQALDEPRLVRRADSLWSRLSKNRRIPSLDTSMVDGGVTFEF